MEQSFYTDIIKRAYELTEEYYAFSYETSYLNGSKITNIEEDVYKQLDYWLKGIRQDYAKILVVMNVIDNIQKNKITGNYEFTYFSLCNSQPNEEIACCIDYLFTRYRSIFDYIYQILLLCIPPQLTEIENEDYNKLEKVKAKYNFFLNHIIKKKGTNTYDILNMKLFKQIIDNRDYLVHDCASCLVFSDNTDAHFPLSFKVWTKNAINEEDEATDDYYSIENNVFVYNKYWGLQIAKLIVFFNTIFNYLKDYCVIDALNVAFIENQCKITRFSDEAIPDKQDVLRNIFKDLID